jgi:DNA polymerase-3 subunit delta'
MEQKSEIIFTKNIYDYTSFLVSKLPLHSYRIIQNEEDGKENFKMEHSKLAIKEAYIASSENKYIILVGDKFEIEAQNRLLKVLEEPPRNIVFIIITKDKSSLLPTIISRMPFKYIKDKAKEDLNNYNFLNMDLKEVYFFLKEHQRVTKKDAIEMVQSLFTETINNKVNLSKDNLELFSNSLKLLELNSRPINILTTLLLTILKVKKDGKL